LVIIMLLCIGAIYSQENKDFTDGFDFTCFGTEPFWSVKINESKEIYFYNLADRKTFTTGVPEYSVVGWDEFSYSASSDDYTVKIIVKISFFILYNFL